MNIQNVSSSQLYSPAAKCKRTLKRRPLALGHMQVCTSLQTDNHAGTLPLSFL